MGRRAIHGREFLSSESNLTLCIYGRYKIYEFSCFDCDPQEDIND